MVQRKKSSRLKSNTSTKAWAMLLEGRSHSEIGKELGYTKCAIDAYAKKKWYNNSMTAWATEIKKVGMCEIPGCGKTEKLNAHHLLHAKIWTHLSRDLTNGICLCPSHHKFDLDICPHGTLPAVLAFFGFIVSDRPGVLHWYEDHKHDVKYQGCDYEAAYRELTK